MSPRPLSIVSLLFLLVMAFAGASSVAVGQPVTPDRGGPAVGSAVTLEDIANHPQESPAIQRMVQQGIMQKAANNNFAPDADLTRGDFAVMMQRMFGLTASRQSVAYSDIGPQSKIYGAVNAVAPYMNFQPLCPGCLLSTQFSPGEKMTRGQVALVMVRILGAKSKVAPLSDAEMRDVLQATPDAKNWPPAARPYFAVAVKNDLLPSQPDRSFAPRLAVTRAQAAVAADGVQQRFSIPAVRAPQ